MLAASWAPYSTKQRCCAELLPGQLGFVAVHGTGTPLGDPIEMGALGAALPKPASAASGGVTIGAVKSCYGHTEGCAGLTGALLAVQALRHQAGSRCALCAVH